MELEGRSPSVNDGDWEDMTGDSDSDDSNLVDSELVDITMLVDISPAVICGGLRVAERSVQLHSTLLLHTQYQKW